MVLNFEAAQGTFITDRGPPKPIPHKFKTWKTDRRPPTFGDGIFPKQVILSVAPIVQLFFSGCKCALPRPVGKCFNPRKKPSKAAQAL